MLLDQLQLELFSRAHKITYRPILVTSEGLRYAKCFTVTSQTPGQYFYEVSVHCLNDNGFIVIKNKITWSIKKYIAHVWEIHIVVSRPIVILPWCPGVSLHLCYFSIVYLLPGRMW